jgi:hypothetical protein
MNPVDGELADLATGRLQVEAENLRTPSGSRIP